MIVARRGGSLRLVTQPDHARLASELLALWRRDALPTHPRRRELLLAVREHDNGWQETDSAPRLDPRSSRPLDYKRMPRELRFEIWRRGIGRLAREDDYAACLVATHALALNRDRSGDAWSAFLEEIAELRAALLESAGEGEDRLESDYGFLRLADRLSLALCEQEPSAGEDLGYRFQTLDGVVHLDPFPLAGATTFRVPSRWIPDRAYSGDVELGSAAANARWQRTELHVRPWPCESGSDPGLVTPAV